MKKLLLGLIGLLFAVPAVATNLPAGYTELEYIESTGTQYIDTGIIPANKKIGAVIDFQYTNTTGTTSGVFGSNSQDGVNNIQFTVFSSKWRYKINDFAAYGSKYDTNRHIVSLNMADGTKLDGNIVTNTQYTIPSTNTQNCFLGACNYNGDASAYILIGKIYSAKVYDDTTLVRDFVPAKNSSGVVGMFDTVSGEFLTNAGTGSFIAGPVVPEKTIKIATTAYNTAQFNPVVTELNDTIATIRSVVTNTINQTKAIADLQATKQTRPNETCPAGKKCLLVEDNDGTPHWYEIIENAYGLPSGYTGLEYLQSDGASYLIIPYRVNNKTVFYCRYNEIQNGLQTASAVFGVTTSPDVSKANYGILRLLNGAAGSYNRMGWGDSTSGSVIDVNAPQNLDTWYEVLYDQNKLYQDNVLYATSATPNDTEWAANYDLGVFARNSTSVSMPAIAKISSVWAKENGEYKINLIPARRNSDNVLGMYDLTNDVFYTNAGSGTFTAGPEI